MAATFGRRFIFSLKNYLFYQPGRTPAWRISVAASSNDSSTNTTESGQNIEGLDESKPDTWNPSKVEEILLQQSARDMPVEMPNPYQEERVECILCKYNVHLDYKNVRLLSQFVSSYTGRIYGRHITRLCRRQQQIMENEIQKSRDAGFMAVMLKSPVFLKDPKLFDPNNPDRPHGF